MFEVFICVVQETEEGPIGVEGPENLPLPIARDPEIINSETLDEVPVVSR